MDYITQTLGIPVHRSKWENIAELPFFLINSYTFEDVESGKLPCSISDARRPVGND